MEFPTLYRTKIRYEELTQEVVAEEPGYYYIYLSNDSKRLSEAFFDDFEVEVAEGPIVQMTDYYPYGLIAQNWVREGEAFTKELFQSKTLDNKTGWYDFHARQYDASLGRWFAMDPQNQFASPYLAMGNNPVVMVDPDGQFAGAIMNALIAGAGQSALFYAASLTTGSGWDWGDFGQQVGMGALTAGMNLAGSTLSTLFSAGAASTLHGVGMGVQASNFIGGALGSFTGTLVGGGMPTSHLSWASALSRASMNGSQMAYNNPLGLTKRVAFEEPLVELANLLPEVLVKSFGPESPSWWWGQTQRFLDGGYRPLWGGGIIPAPPGSSSLGLYKPPSSGAITPVYPESIYLGGITTKMGVRVAVSPVSKISARLAARGAKTFFDGAKYSPKVLRQMGKTDDLFHGFPKSVDGYATKFGKWSTKVGADGKTYQWLKMPGSYGGKTGTFEFIKDANGVINHRFINVH